jgi:hypothetical protein
MKAMLMRRRIVNRPSIASHRHRHNVCVATAQGNRPISLRRMYVLAKNERMENARLFRVFGWPWLNPKRKSIRPYSQDIRKETGR